MTTSYNWNHSTGSFQKINTPSTPTSPSTPLGGTYVPSCNHKGDAVIWTDTANGAKREFVIADYHNCNNATADLCLDLNRNMSAGPIIKGDPAFMTLNKWAGKHTRTVTFDWPDYGIIDVPLSFWLELLDACPADGRVMITCHGGHGRSGTCLAALMIARGMTSGGAMEYIRLMHCHKSIESTRQEAYLQKLALEAVMRGISSATVEEAIAEVSRDDGKFEFCNWCGRSFRHPENTDVCSDCWEDGYREHGGFDLDTLTETASQSTTNTTPLPWGSGDYYGV